MFDAGRPLPGGDHGFDPSRRQLLITLLALPVALVPSVQLGDASSFLVRRLLAQCATSITAAWHLLKQADFAIVEQQVSSYLLALTALARQPSPHQAEAARLASLAYRALGIVTLHRRRFRQLDYCFQQSLLYADIADDGYLRASALMGSTSIALIYHHDPTRAADSIQQAQRHQREIMPSDHSRLSALFALERAMEGREEESLRPGYAVMVCWRVR